MIVAVPVVTPVIVPVVAPAVAVVVLLLVQLPPVVASLSVDVAPMHTTAVPVIAAGNGFTVTVAVFVQPVPNE